jgi:serine/threonine-protein kinase
MKVVAGIAATAIGVFALPRLAADDKPMVLAIQARDVLKERCHGCHKGPGSKGGRFNAFVYTTLVTSAKADDKPVIVPRNLAESLVWQKIEAGEMPEEGSVEKGKFSAAEKEILKRWIEAGAPEWPAGEAAPDRAFISIPQMLVSIRDDLRQTPVDDRPYLRYYTLVHLHNQPRTRISDADLRLYRAAFSKAINSLSWKRSIVMPRAVDKDETILAVDLRDLDWDRDNLWKYVVTCYPYGLTYSVHEDAAYRDPYVEIVALSGARLAFVRADWFVATATRPPLYHALLELPDNAADLEHKLAVDIPRNFLQSRLLRAGFAKSKVSIQSNRLLERHESAYGAYWKSYDFRSGQDRSLLTQFPLGPVFAGNRFYDQAFQQAGGEIIFNLPNGLQAYLLVNAKDQRIDAGPIDVVSDAQKTSGSPVIVNGLSCMACHTEGMKADFADEIRLGTSVGGDAKLHVQRLYPEPKLLEDKLKEDRQRFLDALTRAMGRFLQVGEDVKRPVDTFDEPIGKISRYYRLDDLDATAAAAELGIKSAEVLIAAIQGNSHLRQLGLGPLAKGGHVKRGIWEKIDGNSPMQRTARELDLGTPFREIVTGFSCQLQQN